MKKVVIAISLILFYLPVMSWASPITELKNTQYAAIIEKAKSDPANAKKALLANPPANVENDIAAQYYLLLSQLNYTLVYGEEALAAANKGLALITAEKYPKLFHQLNISKSAAYDHTAEPAKGLPLLNNAIDWARKNKDISTEADALYYRGQLYMSLTNYVKALSDLQTVYYLASNNTITLKAEEISSALALVYEYRHEYQLALPYFEESVAYYRRQNQPVDLSISLYGLGKANLKLNNTDLGLKQLEESLLISTQVDDIQGIAYANKSLADVEIKQGLFSKAEKRLLASFEIFKKGNNPFMKFGCANSLVHVYLQLDQLALAQRYFNLAEQFVDKDNMPANYLNLMQTKANLLSYQKQHQQAYELLQEVHAQYKKIHNKQGSELLFKVRSEFELQQKQQQNALLARTNELQAIQLQQKKNQTYFLMYFLVLTMLIIGLLLVGVYRNKQHKKSLEKLANTDDLTQLLNRRKSFELIEQQLSLSIRHHIEMSIAIIDLDNFKAINDEFGHQIGDKVLQAFARLCNNSLRHSDIIGRYGGEEFIIALPHTTIENAIQLLDNLRAQSHQLAEQLSLNNAVISISAGIASTQTTKQFAELISKADQALYKAKSDGRDRVVAASNVTHSVII